MVGGGYEVQGVLLAPGNRTDLLETMNAGVYHCYILDHEDNGMMGVIVIV